jgi:hypothetical protein
MPLILAIEPDKRQSSQLAAVVKGLKAELVQGATATDALAALHGRVPDLVLTTSLISPRDDAALAAHLRDLGAAAAHVQTVTIPLLGTAVPAPAKGGMLAALRREKPPAPMTDGCAPDVFADQVRQYLATAEEQKAVAATRLTAAPEAVPQEFIEAAPAEEALPELEPEVFAAEPEYVAAIEETAPAGPPLSQLLQFVSDTAPADEPPAPEPIATMNAAEEWQVEEPAPIEETSVEDFVVEELNEEVEAAPAEPAGRYGDLYVDPMAAQALEELSRQAPAQPLADAVPAEAPVPVVEMQVFQNLDDLASLFAAPSSTPARQESTLFAPQHAEFASLFAAPPPASRPVEPIDVPGIDPSLFASAPTAPKRVLEIAPEPVFDVAPDLLVPTPELFIEPAPVPVFEPEPASVFEPAPEPVLEIAAAPFVELAPEPISPIVPDPVLTEFEVPEPEPMMAAEFEVESEPVLEDPPLAFALPAVEPLVEAPVIEAPVAMAAAPDFTDERSELNGELDEEIALDVDAFAYTEPEPAAPAEPARFAFTLVDGFGDAWSDFELPSVAAMAADLGLGEHAPLDPYAATAAPAESRVRREEANEPLAAPALDDEALSLIGAAARQVSLDALVIREFERGGQVKQVKKIKKKVHAGATQVAPAPERPAAKPASRPAQDEWGMFDPEQAGFAALEDEEGAEARPTTGTRVRVISY